VRAAETSSGADRQPASGASCLRAQVIAVFCWGAGSGAPETAEPAPRSRQRAHAHPAPPLVRLDPPRTGVGVRR
jgi:hypothetical protein